MKRRAVLVSIAGVAGCTGAPSATDTPTATDGRTPTGTPPDTATPTGSPAPTDESTPTESPTPEGKAIAAEHIDEARSQLAAAAEAYDDGAGPNTDWMDVDARHAVSVDDVELHLDEAGEALSEAAEHAATDQQAVVNDLKHLQGYIGRVAGASNRSHGAWVDVEQAAAACIAEEFSSSRSYFEAAEVDRAVLANRVDRLRQAAEPGAAAELEAFAADAYSAKIDQLAAEAAAPTDLSGVVSPADDAMDQFATAVDLYIDERYSNAFVEFWGAMNKFETAIGELPDGVADAYAGHLEDLTCFLTAVRDASEDLYEADEQTTGRDEHEADALTALSGCSLVDDSPTALRLKEHLQ